MIKLRDLIAKSAERGIKLQAEDGSMPAGHNGPHNDPETPVRNTAHWCITFLKVNEWTGKDEFKKAARKAAEYLVSKEARPMNATFWFRKNPQKDFSNGLIGQAWVMEALALCSSQLETPKYGEIAKEVFLLHPFDEKVGLWQAINVDGSYLPFKATFNQQLWFATTGILLLKNTRIEKEVDSRVKRFLEQFQKHLFIHSNGLICHRILSQVLYKSIISKLKCGIDDLKRRYQHQCHAQGIGYHAFNLYAFALLKEEGGLTSHTFWKNYKFRRALKYLMTQEYRDLLAEDKYAFSYNPVGFEVAFALNAFSDYVGASNSKSADEWVHEQLRRHYCLEKDLMCKNTTDPNTLATRIYEATRLPNIEINIEAIKNA